MSKKRNGSFRLWCERRQHHAPLACAVAIILWGPDASSDKLRASVRCTSCGGKGATLQRPGWAGNNIGFYPFPTGSACATMNLLAHSDSRGTSTRRGTGPRPDIPNISAFPSFFQTKLAPASAGAFCFRFLQRGHAEKWETGRTTDFPTLRHVVGIGRWCGQRIPVPNAIGRKQKRATLASTHWKGRVGAFLFPQQKRDTRTAAAKKPSHAR
jgi:hypothetical protein